MPRRGLNRKRGLESLIPQMKQMTGDETPDGEQETAGAEEKAPDREQQTAGAEKKAPEKDRIPADSGKSSEIKKKVNTPSSPAAEDAAAGGTAAGKTPTEGAAAEGMVKKVRLSMVVPNHDQPRKKFDETAIHELAESVKQYGVLQPLLVQKKGRYYEIIAGERRWRAAREAGLKEIPVIVRDFSDQETMEISLIENIQREDLNPIEEAEAYRVLITEYHMTQEEAASRVGKSRTAVTNSLRLLKLTPEVRQMVIDGSLSMGHARALLGLEDEALQTAAAQQVAEKQLSVRETERLVKKLLEPPASEKTTKKKFPDEQTALAYRDLEDKIQKKLGTRVAIHAKSNERGKIEIEYYSQEDLERILDVIG